jgi:hypothetical protein
LASKGEATASPFSFAFNRASYVPDGGALRSYCDFSFDPNWATHCRNVVASIGRIPYSSLLSRADFALARPLYLVGSKIVNNSIQKHRCVSRTDYSEAATVAKIHRTKGRYFGA